MSHTATTSPLQDPGHAGVGTAPAAAPGRLFPQPCALCGDEITMRDAWCWQSKMRIHIVCWDIEQLPPELGPYPDYRDARDEVVS